jgi:hypothetical protein
MDVCGCGASSHQLDYLNGYATLALARREGCELVDLGIVPDRLAETAAGVRRAREVGADILVTFGGASVGDYDLVREALAAEGLALSFWKVGPAPRVANDAWPIRPHACSRPAGQSGLGLCVRGAVSPSAHSAARGSQRCRAGARDGAAGPRSTGKR